MSSDMNATVSSSEDFNPFAGGAIARVVATTQPQREIWLADRLSEEASLAYNESVSLRLRGKLDVGALQGAVQDVVDAHEALRSTISGDGQEMFVAETVTLDIPVIDLSARAQAEQTAAIAAATDRVVRTKFDLDTGPLIRAEVLKLSAEDHVLVLTAHHIVCDGWSFGVIVRDLAAFYAARLGAGTPPGAGDSFAEYAQQELAHEGSPEQQADEAFWLSKFSGSVPTLDLPTDRPRKAWRSFASRRLDLLLDSELTAQVRRWGAKQGAGLPATLTGTFAAVLQRISGAASVVVGMPAAGQSVAGQQRLVGHGVNLLPLRFEIDPKKSIAALIGEAKAVVLDAYDHQRYTFGTLLQKLTLPRDPGRLPLVSVMFNVDQALDESSIEFPGLRFEFTGNPRAAENFELFVNIVPITAGLRVEVQYNTDLFDESTIRRWFGAFETALRAAVADGSKDVGSLPMLSPQALQELIALQPAATPYERDVLMHQFVERQADKTPDTTALVFGKQSLSYAQLDRRANQIAHLLRQMGVKRGVVVGLCVNRGIDTVTSLIGIMKAGGTYLPLDPAFPAERLSFMTEDAAIGALITEADHFDKTGITRDKALLLDESAARLAGMPTARLPHDAMSATPETAAYVIYTSGSTGRPKGVQVPHRAIANFFAAMQATPGVSAGDTLVAVTTISFDIAVFELMLPLTVGARVVIASRDEVTDAGSLRRLLESTNATLVQATPSGWRLLLESGWTGQKGFKAVCGGEALAPDLAAALLQCCSEVWNAYGPTETTVWSTFWRVANPELGISIGRPVGNTTVWILDENQQPCPLGVPGEICIGGDGVTLGYLNRPELNAERFLDNNFDARGGKVYRTGDRGRWLADGTLEHLGRLDFQVKVRGYRVELGEIETNLLAIPTVARAVAMAREDRPGDVRLVAYIVAPHGANVAEADLRQHLQKILPEYFIPQHFVILPAIPLLPNGKVDRKALPAPNAPKNDRQYAPPRNDQEKAVAKIMEDALGLPGVSINDDFFALGGHSLLAAQLTARINREFNIKLTLRTLFDAPTVERLTEKIQAEQSAGTVASEAPIVSRAEQRKAPLSIMQERLWFLEQLHPGRVVYNTPSAHRLRGKLDYEVFSRAFGEMVRHQPSLRTAVAVENGIAMQAVHDQVPFALLPPEDLSSIPAGQREENLLARLDELTNEPFSLTQPPLFRVRLFKLADQEHVLLFVPHHLIWDGWSFDLFYAELAATYEAFLAQRPSPLAPLPISYGDFSVWHRQWLEGPEFARQIHYWRDRLADISSVSELPVDRPRRPGMSGEGCTEWLSVDKETTEALRELSRKADATLFMTLLAIYYVLLHRVSGQPHLVIGTPVRGRNLTEVEQVMGYFTNLLPLHLEMDPQEPFVDLVKRVKATVLDSFAYPDVPLEMLLRELTVQRGDSGSLLYQALFSFQDARHRASNWGGLSHEQILVFQRGATEDLGLWFLDNDHGMVGGVTYNSDIITAATARLLRERYTALTSAVLAAPDMPIGQLGMELQSDYQSLNGWNNTVKELEGPGLLHQHFEAIVDRTPDDPAAIVGGWNISYRDIERQANRIAHGLQARGVKAGSVVALCEEPGQGFMSTLLAIFKAGGACLILDAALSTSRVASALAASGASVLAGNSRYKDIATGSSVKTLWLDTDANEIAALPDTRLAVASGTRQPAVLIDLVGMQDVPRLVSLSHRAILNTLLSVRDAVGLKASHRCLVSGAASAESTALEWLLPWTAGAACVVAKAEAAIDADALLREIASAQATFLHLPSECWQALFTSGWRPEPGVIGLLSGEKPSSDLAEQIAQSSGSFWRVWGRAETGVWTTLNRIQAAEDASVVGKQISNTEVRALDEQGRPRPVGVWGDLWVCSASLAEGYIGEPALTAERFRPIPGETSGRSCVLSERGRWRADGRIELQPRDNRTTVVIGNTRIDIAALTALVRQQDAVTDATCTVRTGNDGRPRVVAYASSSDIEARNRLRQVLADRVPPVAGPAEVVVLAELPRLPDGRIDARSLPSPEDTSGQTHADSFVEPQTETEKALAAIWCDLLGLQRVSSRDNFFDLGGHSLLAMQAITKMEQKTGKQIAARRYMFQTLAQLASSYEEEAATPETTRQKTSLVGRLLGALRGSGKR